MIYSRQTYDALFLKHSKVGRITILVVYIDDIIVTEDNIEEENDFKKVLATEFEIKYLGNLMYFLGMKVSRKNLKLSYPK